MKLLVMVVVLLGGGVGLFRSPQEVRYAQFAQKWAERGVNVFTAVDVNGDSMLHIAARTGNIVVAKYWLDNGAEIDVLNNRGESPLYVAIDSGHSMLADYYLASGADFIDNIDQANPVVAAAYRNEKKILKRMLKGGADPNATDKHRRPPLTVANHSSVVKILLATEGIEVDKADSYNRQTPLHSFARFGHFKAVKLLIDAGADPSALDKDGKTPADLAEEGLSGNKYDWLRADYHKTILLLRSLELKFEPVQ